MAQQAVPTVENHFIAGLKTEYTGLNFPENAATDTQNCVYSLIGDVTRRGGLDFEDNFRGNPIDTSNVARSTFRWLNAGGDGVSQILVEQIGKRLYFYLSSAATVAAPLSTTLLSSVIDISLFLAPSSPADPSLQECQYAMGNGYLFVFHPNCDSFFCTFANGLVTAAITNIQIRDFIGIPEPGIADNFRPTTLSQEHKYNLVNQGWTVGAVWTGSGTAVLGGGFLDAGGSTPGCILFPAPGTTVTINLSSQVNTTSITNGSQVSVSGAAAYIGANNGQQNIIATFVGSVTSYVTPFTSISIFVNTVSYAPNFNRHQPSAATGFWSGSNFTSTPGETLTLTLSNAGFIDTWKQAIGNYPSNSDVWWLYIDATTGLFSPGPTFGSVQQTVSPAPKGSFLMNPFIQDRSTSSNIPGLTPISTFSRPSTGAFFQGRVWYAGINDFKSATGDAPNTTWTENIYFSQIIESTLNFGKCYQTNDPTTKDLFTILPSDGGVITIPGCGAIYKLFTLRYGLLVFAANGIWFIGGSSGIGFSADDFTITKISSIQAIAGTSFVDVQGYPMFWNQEGIYQVVPASQPGSAHSPDIQLDVQNLCLGTILTYYSNIPLISKPYARGDFDQLGYVVQWCFRSTNEAGISNRYNYDTILNYNTVTKAFYPWTLPASVSRISDIKYVQNPGGSGAPSPILKYVVSYSTINANNITFAEENDFSLFRDFFSENLVGYNYISYFITGYKLKGNVLTKFQTPYTYVFSRNPSSNSYAIQAIWDYAGSGLSGKWSTKQIKSNSPNNFSNMYHKIRLRGRGLAMQIKVTSVDGKPFDLMGWSVLNEVNVGI